MHLAVNCVGGAGDGGGNEDREPNADLLEWNEKLNGTAPVSTRSAISLHHRNSHCDISF